MSDPWGFPLLFSGATTTGKDGVKRVTGFINGKILRATEYTFDKGQTAVRKNTPPPLGPDGQPLPSQPGDGNRPLVSRLLLAGDILLTSVEASTGQVLGASTTSATKSIAHKYGQEAGEAAGLAGGSVRNVGVAFVDARCVAWHFVSSAPSTAMLTALSSALVTQGRRPPGAR